MHKIFVYGELQSGRSMNHYLEGGKLVGEAKTTPVYILWDFGWHPGLTEVTGTQFSKGYSIHGEVWEVSDEMFEEIDYAEGPCFKRTVVKLQKPYDKDSVEAYLYKGETTGCSRSGTRWAK